MRAWPCGRETPVHPPLRCQLSLLQHVYRGPLIAAVVGAAEPAIHWLISQQKRAALAPKRTATVLFQLAVQLLHTCLRLSPAATPPFGSTAQARCAGDIEYAL